MKIKRKRKERKIDQSDWERVGEWLKNDVTKGTKINLFPQKCRRSCRGAKPERPTGRTIIIDYKKELKAGNLLCSKCNSLFHHFD